MREAYGPFADVMDLDRVLTEIWDPRHLALPAPTLIPPQALDGEPAAVTARLDRIEKKLDTLLMERAHGE